MVVSTYKVMLGLGCALLMGEYAEAAKVYPAQPDDDLAAVVARIRAERAGTKTPCVLELAEGVYPMPQTLELDARDDGLTIRSRAGVRAVLDGGARITGFKPFRDGIYVADVSRLPFVREPFACYGGIGVMNDRNLVIDLYRDGEPLVVAREPDVGFFKTGKVWNNTKFIFESPDLEKLGVRGERGLFATGYWRWIWADASFTLESIEGTPTPRWQLDAQGAMTGAYSYRNLQPNMPFFVCNSLKFLNRDCEWVLDRANAKVYVKGRPDAEYVLTAVAGPILHVKDASGVCVEGVHFRYGRGNGVEVQNCRGFVFRDNVVESFGGTGVVCSGGKDCTLEGNSLHTFGYKAAILNGGNRTTLTSSGCVFADNEVTDTGRSRRTYSHGVAIGGCGVAVLRNYFHDLPSSSISMGGNDHLIASNITARVVLESEDQGGIDTFGNPFYQGNRVIHNVWRDIGCVSSGFAVNFGKAGVRLDDQISGFYIYGNRFDNCSRGKFGGVQIHGGRDNDVVNNVFTRCKWAVSFSPWPMNRWHQFWYPKCKSPESVNVFSDIWKKRYGDLMRLKDMPNVNRITRNVVIGAEALTNGRCKGEAVLTGNFELPAGAPLDYSKLPGFDPLPPESALGPNRTRFAPRRPTTEKIFKGGLWKTFTYDQPNRLPIVVSGESRCENARAEDYCIYLDIWHPDGSNTWCVRFPWQQGTHGWEAVKGAYVPTKPVSKIEMHVFLRRGSGRAEFRALSLERREGTGERFNEIRRCWRPFENVDTVTWESLEGGKLVKRERREPSTYGEPPSSVPPAGFAVWTADSMRKVTPLTFPTSAEVAVPRAVALELACRERESFQVQISCGAAAEWKAGNVQLPVLKNARGEALKGEFKWERVGYVAREPGYCKHVCGVDDREVWLPDPLLPAAPYRVRKGSTQGLWFTVQAAPDAAPGVYAGEVALTEGGKVQTTVRVQVRVRGFSLPSTFGMPTAFCVMDGFTRAQYGDARSAEMRRQSWEIMLDHRLNPDDISRTSPPPIADLLHARARGMNRFNILNIVPPPKDPKTKWVCFVSPEATFNPTFYGEFKARLAPYVAELRKHDLVKYAYLYGFDERREEYYAGIDKLWRQLKADFPDVPVMTTAMMYADKVRGKSKSPYLETTDWFCPLTAMYRPDISAELRAKGKQVWWYTCCGPRYPYANMSSLEYPTIEGRLLGWMTHRYRSDGLLFWHVNYWHNNPCLDENDTFLRAWHTYSGLHMPGDGIFLYPGKQHVLPSIRLAQVRDGVEDYEWLQLAAAKAGLTRADAESGKLVKSMTDFTRDPAALRSARTSLGDLIE